MFRFAVLLLAVGSIAGLCQSFAATKPNIILITLDSTRADRMGFLGGKAKITPGLDALARQSIVFERAYAQAPTTVVSHATLLTGTYPQTHGASEFGTILSAAVPFTPDILRSRGYRTAAFVGSILLDPKIGFAGFDRGFGSYDAGFRPSEHGQTRLTTVERRADQVVVRTTAWLEKNSQSPFFLWLELHGPAGATSATYNAAITSVDSAVTKLVAMLRAKNLYDDALIVVAADHGQSLGAHAEDTHGIFLYDDTIHVPLLVKLPQNQNAGKRVQTRVGLVDVAATMLEVAGVPVPSQMQGQSLLRIAKANAGDQPVYSRSDFPQKAFGWSALASWRVGKYLYIRAPMPELYDLTSDPSASHNLAQSSKATLDTIASQLDAFDQHFNSGKSARPELTSSEMQKLASLGYVGLQKSSGSSTSVTGTDPKDGIADANKVLAAMAAIDDGKPEKAIALLQTAAPTLNNSYLAQFALGVAQAQQQQFPPAIERLHRAIELHPDSASAHYQMGICLLKTADYKTAAVHLEIAATRMPGFASAHSSLAQAYDHLGRPQISSSRS
jgi:arylsulfatase A-like enzyme